MTPLQLQLVSPLGPICLQLHPLRPTVSTVERGEFANVAKVDGVLRLRLILKRR